MVNFIKRKFNKMVDARLIGLQDRIGFLDKRIVELEGELERQKPIVDKLNTIVGIEKIKQGIEESNHSIVDEWFNGAKEEDGDDE